MTDRFLAAEGLTAYCHMLDGDNIFHLVAKVTQCKSRLRIFLNDGFELQLAKHPDVCLIFLLLLLLLKRPPQCSHFSGELDPLSLKPRVTHHLKACSK